MNYINKNFLMIFSISIVVLLTIISLMFISNVSKEEKIHLKDGLIREATAHFNNIVIARRWNAKYGGVFVNESDGIKPNPYLKDNMKLDANGKVMVKVNPAWMTRQISTLSNIKNGYFYKITSLKPMNPINAPDDFEKEALKYFKSNKDENFYYNFDEKFNFIGSLKVEKACLNCHQTQGYSVNDIIGGIRVSIPTDIYEATVKTIDKKEIYYSIIVVIGAVFFSILLLYIIRLLYLYKFQKDEIKEKDKLLLRAQNIANFGFWKLDFKDNTLSLSPELYKTFELNLNKFGSSYDAYLDIIHPDDRDIVNEAYKVSLKMKEPYEITYRLIMTDSSIKYITQKCETTFDENGEPLESIGTIQDITELQNVYNEVHKKDEIMIAQSRHAAMGEMISMIAHQWRQPISVVAMQANNILADIELEMVDDKSLKNYCKFHFHVSTRFTLMFPPIS